MNAELQVNATFFNDRLDIVSGIFYLHDNWFSLQDLTILGELFPIGVDASFEAVQDAESDVFAVYSHGIFSITPKIKFSFGARFNHESKNIVLKNGALTNPGSFDQSVNPGDASFDNFQPKFGMDYIFNDDLFFYAVISKGFASGGFNGRPDPSLPVAESFGEESLWNFEVGFKSDWFDNRARLNFAAFYMDFSNIVVSQFGVRPDDPLGRIGFFLKNSGGATVKGLEVEATILPIPQLRLSFNLGLLDQEFNDFGIGADGLPIDPKEAKFFDSPSTTISVVVNYTQQLAEDWGEISLSADWSYRSKVFFDNSKTLVSGDGARDIVNARVRYTPPNGQWNFGFFVENLFGEVSLSRNLNILEGLGINVVRFDEPRTMGVFIEFHW